MDDKQTQDFARRIVAIAAPEEANQFDTLAKRKLGGADKDPLRSGFPGAFDVLTPVVIFVAGKIVELIAEHIIRKTGKQAHWFIRRLVIRRKARSLEVEELILPVTPANTRMVYDKVIECVTGLGHSEADAVKVADAVVSLVVRGQDGES